MWVLRTTSTRRLLAAITGIVLAIVAGSAIAIAAVGSGPVPPRSSLAAAVHRALAAPSVSGISARVTFTNRLIDSTDIQGSDPLLTGASGRMWLAPGHGLRLELQSDNGDAQVLVDNGSFWAYDPAEDTVFEGHLPTAAASAKPSPREDALPTIAQIQSAIERVSAHATVSGAIPGDVAGRPTYTVRIAPAASSGGLFGGVALAFDAVHGVPLRFSVFARGDATPVIELSATSVSYGPVSSSVFNIRPPAGARVVDVDLPSPSPAQTAQAARARRGVRAPHAEVSGASAVARRVSFPLDAPASAGGLTRSSVTLLGRGRDAGALITYGQGLGAVDVIERPAGARSSGPLSSAQSSNPDQPGLSLPSVSVRGSTAQELGTALGTLLTFDRAGVSYTIAGSVPQATAERVARSL